MKTWILAMAMMVGMTLSAQEKKMRHEPLKPEQRVELQTKKMALQLDLNDKQQKEVEKLLLDRNKERKQLREHYKAQKMAGKKLTADERFAMKSKILDDKIEMKQAMKKILTPEQYSKFEKVRAEKKGKITKRSKNFKNHNRR